MVPTLNIIETGNNHEKAVWIPKKSAMLFWKSNMNVKNAKIAIILFCVLKIKNSSPC